MTDNLIPFSAPSGSRNMNAVIVEILQDISDDRVDPQWPARVQEWAAEHEDPLKALSDLAVAGVWLLASVLIDADDALPAYIGHARKHWPGVTD